MGSTVLGPQEIPDTLINSYLIAKIWIETLNFGDLNFSVLSNLLHLCFIVILMEQTCIIRSNNFQIVPNCGEGSVPKSYHHRHLKLCCFPPSPYAIGCGKCCVLPVFSVNTSLGRNARHIVEWDSSWQTINALPFDTQQSNHVTIR